MKHENDRLHVVCGGGVYRDGLIVGLPKGSKVPIALPREGLAGLNAE